MQPMSTKNPSSSNSQFQGRFTFYLLLSLLFTLLNALKDLQDESPVAALLEQLVLFPFTFLFVMGVYFFRKNLVASTFFSWLLQTTGLSNFWAWSFVSLPLSLLFGVCFRIISLYLYNDDESSEVFDLLFLAISTGIFIIAAFVYLLEAYLELEVTEKHFRLKILQVENEKTLAQYQVLKNQLNPHFLFNSFNSLISLIYRSPAQAEQFVHQLSAIYRYNLEQGEELVVPLSYEIRLIQSYIELKRIRFGESISFRYEIPPSHLSHLLPPMTLTLLIENAIKHNHFDQQNPLNIAMELEEEHLFITNTYRPKNTKGHQGSLGIGLKNLVNQYVLLEAPKPEFWIEGDTYRAKISLIEPSL